MAEKHDLKLSGRTQAKAKQPMAGLILLYEPVCAICHLGATDHDRRQRQLPYKRVPKRAPTPRPPEGEAPC